MTREKALSVLESMDREITHITHIAAILEWDMQAGGMPSAAAAGRGEQMGWLETQAHALASSDRMGEALAVLGASTDHPSGDDLLDDRTAALVRLRYDAWTKSRTLTPDFVQRNAVAVGKSQVAWTQARKTDDWELFQPHLEEIVSLSRERAELYRGKRTQLGLYDVLLDIYEPGMTDARLQTVFGQMEKSLRNLLSRIMQKTPPREDFLHTAYPVDLQARFSRKVLSDMGFDFSRGMSGLSAHPFTTTLGADDIRITTHYGEASVADPLFSSVHEGGHALYEMAASYARTAGTSLAGGTSLGIHESQSRLWENIIARSPAFWEHYYPVFSTLFPEQTEGVSSRDFVRAVNVVRPSLIRTASDEVTYGLHILVRYNIERALIAGDIEVKDLPQVWNDTMEKLVGVRPATNKEGVLQDIHWAGGSFGYFPTYALGNLYGAQFWYALREQLGAATVDHDIARGDFTGIKSWLESHVWRHGCIYPASVLIEKATGSALDGIWFERYLEDKYSELYSL